MLHAGVVTTTDVDVATKDVAIAVMVGGFPRKAGMERKDVMAKNVSIYKSQASSLEKNAATGVKASQRIFALILPTHVLQVQHLASCDARIGAGSDHFYYPVHECAAPRRIAPLPPKTHYTCWKHACLSLPCMSQL